MKRILILLLVLSLSLSVLIGCDAIKKTTDKVKDFIGLGGEQSGEVPNEGEQGGNNDNGNNDNGNNEVVDDLPNAVTFLHNLYKEKNEITARDFDVIGQVLIDGVKFPVTWTCDDDRISIEASVKPNAYTVNLPQVNEEEFTYTLTATITDTATGRSEQKSYTFKVPVLAGTETDLQEGVAYKLSFNQLTLGQRLFALNTTQNGQNKFINSTSDPKEAPDFYAEKVEGGYKFYTEINGVKNYVYAQLLIENGKDYPSKYVGFSTENGSVFTLDEIGAWYTLIDGSEYGLEAQAKYGFGTYSDYSTLCISEWSHFTASSVGTSQFVAEFIPSEYAETLEPEEQEKVEEPEANTTLTIPEAIELGLKVTSYTTNKYYVVGEITEIYNTQYGNMYIKDANGNQFCIYGTYSADGKVRFDAMENQPKVGDTITVYGIIGHFNTTAQMKDGWIVSINGEGEGPVVPETPTLGVVDPVVDTAYKFGMVQGNLDNAIYYLAGGMAQTYYLATTTDASAAIDVYLEAAENGYYLYTLDASGAKLYINMVVSGTHVNGAYEATPSTIYTYDATNKTIIASVQPEGAEAPADYWFGTRNDKTYTTVGPCAVSYAGFYCQFYAASEGGEVTPPEGGEGGSETPVDPQPPVSGNEIVFDFGENGTAGTHADGNDIGTTKTYTSGNYSLVITDALKAFDGGFDKAGNSILKFGTSSVAGTITFVVPDDVTSVVIYAARYKNYADNNIIVVNGTEYALTTNSDDGQYEAITIDTTTNKTVTVASSTSAAKPRCVVNSIVWVIGEGGSETPVDPQPPVHEHTYVDGKCECGEIDPNYQPPTVDPETPVEGEWKVVTELKAGDQVLIGAPAYGKLLSVVKVATYYNKGVDYSATDFSNVTNDEIFVVGVDANGNYTFTSLSGKVIALAADYSSLNETGVNNGWILEAKSDGIFYVKNAVRGNYLEWYASKDNWSTYTTSSLSDLFELSFYVKNEAGSETPVDPEPPVHEHNYVDGKCECGETDPNYQPPTVDPETPVVGGSSADFDSIVTSNANGDSSYKNTYTTTNGWVTANSAIQCGGASDMNPQFTVIGSDNTSKAVCMNGKTSAPGSITSPTLNGGISKITINFTKMFTDTELSFTVTVTDVATGTEYTKVVSRTLDKNEKYVVYTEEWVLDTAITGDFTIELVNNCPTGQDGNKDRVTILDLIWE